MTCAEFQRELPYIIDTGGNAAQEEHLRHCAVCADLVADLNYIADQAKLLVPMEDPSPRVWEGLQKSLEREGLVKSAPARGNLLGLPARSSWGWLAAAAAVVVIGFALLLARRTDVPQPVATAAPAQQKNAMDGDDQQVLQVVATRAPDLRASYEQGLQSVNAYIADAKRSLEQNPDDSEAKQFLMQAYEQKAMLYQMAARSGE